MPTTITPIRQQKHQYYYQQQKLHNSKFRDTSTANSNVIKTETPVTPTRTATMIITKSPLRILVLMALLSSMIIVTMVAITAKATLPPSTYEPTTESQTQQNQTQQNCDQ